MEIFRAKEVAMEHVRVEQAKTGEVKIEQVNKREKAKIEVFISVTAIKHKATYLKSISLLNYMKKSKEKSVHDLSSCHQTTHFV